MRSGKIIWRKWSVRKLPGFKSEMGGVKEVHPAGFVIEVRA